MADFRILPSTGDRLLRNPNDADGLPLSIAKSLSTKICEL